MTSIIIVGLWAVVFLATICVAEELSSPTEPLHKGQNVPPPGDKKRVAGFAEQEELLKRTMDEVFSVLNTIIKEQGLSLKEKQKKAMEYIRTFRYGRENKDYFWINDLQGIMLVDPYLPDFEGKDLSDFSDPNGIKVFAQFIRICRGQGEGYATHLWPKYEEKRWNFPKLSFVRLLKPWGWVVGTGLYLEVIEVFDMPEDPGTIDEKEIPVGLPASPV